ncbi:MAG: 30S ribosomal protein S4 [Myxococcota bacterium]
MARFSGPRLKVVRRFGQHLPGLTRKSAENRPYPPGQHGLGRRPKPSDYRIRLEEKQKLRFNYGLSERQLRKYFRKAAASKGDTGQNLLRILESRLDNVAFRAGFAPTIPAARQLVAHGHLHINGKRVDIPSYMVRAGDVLKLREKAQKNAMFADNFAAPTLEIPSYLSRDDAKMEATFTGDPTREDVPIDLQENLIIEHYSRVA